jgi:SNF2 family DNA or RNA helicase
MIYNPYEYQKHATQHIIENTGCGLFMEMGLGKTVCTLTAIDVLLNQALEVTKVLVIAPKRVAEDTWISEAGKWEHLKHLSLSLVLGTEKQRKEALRAKADIYVINRENVVWLVSYLGIAWPFDMVVIDELSSFKSNKAARFKALRLIRPKIDRVVGLTGTPAPNGLLDLWPQLYLLDQGERLEKTISKYRDKYFKPGKRNGHIIYEYDLKVNEQEIYDKIGDICISMKAEDYLQLPDKVERSIAVKLKPETYQKYVQFERDQILALSESDRITAINAAALTNKLLQYANGAVYDDTKIYHDVHDEKLEELAEIIEAADGKPVLVFYSYQHDLHRIKRYFNKLKPKQLCSRQDIQDWNNGKINLLVAHPASAGHGLNLQAGGNIIVWFGLPWSLELYQQANARLYRQGQTQAVIIHRLIATGTMDEDVLTALDGKADSQEALMQAVKARIKKYLKQAA